MDRDEAQKPIVQKLGGEVKIKHLTPEQLKNISFDYLNYDLIENNPVKESDKSE